MSNVEIFKSDVSSKGVVVYNYLRTCCNKDMTCYPAINTIAENTRLSASGVKRGIDELCSDELLGLTDKKYLDLEELLKYTIDLSNLPDEDVEYVKTTVKFLQNKASKKNSITIDTIFLFKYIVITILNIYNQLVSNNKFRRCNMKKRLSILCAFALIVTLSTSFTTVDSSSTPSRLRNEQICGT